jgi:signal transduction histidine kinase
MNETFMINTIIGELLLLFKSKALLHDVQIETDLTQTPPVRGDRDQLKQVFLNLFNNSVEAMPGGGTIIVRTAYDPSGKYVLIKIKDTGPGIPAEILDRLGKPFVTTKKTGTGLGLSLCYRIINHHFGKISVTTSPEWGTEFVITLPAINAEAPESCCLA